MTTGKITPFRQLAPDDVTPRQVVSFETSDMFGMPGRERYNPDQLASRQGLRIYSKMTEDEQVKAVLSFRLASITARGFEFKYDDDSKLSGDERARRIKFYQYCVTQLRGSFHDGLMAVLRGHQFGFSLTEKVFDVIDYEGRPATGLAMLLPRDPQWFRFFTDRFGTLVKCEQWIGNDKLAVDLSKFIHYVRAPAEDRYYGQSDLRAAYRPWYMKGVILTLYGTYLERFAGGFAYAELADGSTLGTGNPEYTKLQDALSDMRNLASLILPPGVKLTVFQPSNSGEYREALTYLDLAIAKSMLVPNLLGLSHTGQTGAFSQSQTQLEAYFMTTAADTARLEDTLNEQLFNDLGDLNFGDRQYPRFCFKPASAEHVKWIIETWKGLVGGNVVMTTEADENHLRNLLDMPSRTDEDSLIAEEKQELDLAKSKAEAEFAPKPAAFPYTLDQLNDTLRERDERLLMSMRDAITNIGPTPGPDGSTRPVSKDRTGAASARFHLPGQHDQEDHGNWADGSGGGQPTHNDIAAVRADVQRWPSESAKAIAKSALDSYKADIEDMGGRLHVVRVSGQVTGLVVTAPHFDEKSLSVMYLASGYRMRGGGSALMEKVFDQAASEGVGVLLDSTKEAVQFYKAMGGEEVDESQFYWSPDRVRQMVEDE